MDVASEHDVRRADKTIFENSAKLESETEVIAEYIQELDDADLFKVEPAVEYPADYMECIDVAKKEQQADERPEIKETLDNIDAYDTIYIGFPNWWGTLPLPSPWFWE